MRGIENKIPTGSYSAEEYYREVPGNFLCKEEYTMSSREGSDELWKMSAGDLAAAIKTGEVSCTEVVKAHLARIDDVNPRINAVTVKLEEKALQMAAERDRALPGEKPAGSLFGIPFTVKENLDLAGYATTSGMPVCKDAVSPVDAPHIAQLIKAGAIPIARTNVSEMCMRPHSDNPLWGAVINPWGRKLTPGGSSGGEAAAVATGMTPLGMGNDYGGSLRVPAQFCGVASIKPTTGRVASHSALMPGDPFLTLQLFFSNGPIARKVNDLRLALNAMSGYDARDPQWVPAPLGGDSRKRPVKVAFVTEPPGIKTDKYSLAALNMAAECLSDEGYIVEEAEPPSIIEGWKIFMQLVAMELRSLFIPAVSQFMSKKIKVFMEFFCDMSPGYMLEEYIQGFSLRNGIAREWNIFFEKYPVILCPVYAGAVPEPDFDIKSKENFYSFMKNSGMVIMANFLGLPAVSLPMGTVNGLPVSVQFISGRFREDICLDVAEDIEKYVEQFTPVTPAGL